MVKVMPTNPEVVNDPVEEQPLMSPKEVPDSSAVELKPDDAPTEVTPPRLIKEGKSSSSSVKLGTSSRGRVMSLDRGQDAMTADDDNSTVTSDGESSYFAKHLPDPKSSRLYSDTGSISSGRARPTYATRESDASLSFSDDEEEFIEEEYRASPLLAPNESIPQGDDLHFRGIARMHSPSSLVSDPENEDMESRNAPRVLSAEHERPHNNPGYSFFAQPQPSPPTISTQPFQHPNAMPHPQALSAQQMQAWMGAGNAAAFHALNDAYNSGEAMGLMNSVDDGKGSTGTLPLVYSEDEDTIEDRAFSAQGNSARSHRGGGNFQGRQGGPSIDQPTERSSLLHGDSDVARAGAVTATDGEDSDLVKGEGVRAADGSYKVYWQRWLMLMYMSILNLLSDWTCYSVAPIATLTQAAFGSIDPEQLVVVFLAANAIATVCEPILLARIGLRRTVVFGAFLLMAGSVVKSGGFPPIMSSNLENGQGEWRVYLGFFLVGLSQPLYQCTPALLSASWFPEQERTIATGVALNSNQLGIGVAYIAGTILVDTVDDIVPYFGLLSIISTVAFIGSLLQFKDAPPTKPSDTAKVMRGDMQWDLPGTSQIWESVRNLGYSPKVTSGKNAESTKPFTETSPSTHAATRRRTSARPRHSSSGEAPAPSASNGTGEVRRKRRSYEYDRRLDPSPMMPGAVKSGQDGNNEDEYDSPDTQHQYSGAPGYVSYPTEMAMQGHQFVPPQHSIPPFEQPPPEWQYQQPYAQYANTPTIQGTFPFQQNPQGIGYYQNPNPYYYASAPQQFAPQQYPPQQYLPQPYPSQPYPFQPYPLQPHPQQHHFYPYDQLNLALAPPSYVEEYAEPKLTMTDNHLTIDIRDDQILLSFKACFARPGFIHSLVTFTVSGIVINTLSTFMDYLVRLNGAGRYMVGLVGGSFQFVIMISSLIIGKQTDKTRAYYSVTIAMLVMGAFALAECGVSLDADRGNNLRWALLVVAILVGPLQPVSTELGVEVAFPLSENTVLVIQQLFSNLLSALFIPFFKALKDVGTEQMDSAELYERPEYTFSFYLLIVLHAAVTVFFATFNGRYLRYEQELMKKESEKLEKEKEEMAAYEKQFKSKVWGDDFQPGSEKYPDERQSGILASQVL